MAAIDYIAGEVTKLVRKTGTRDPYRICKELDIRIRYKDMGTDIKAFYFYHSRIRNIVVNSRISRPVQRILVAHELGHDRLHKDIALSKGFQELELFDSVLPTEYEANVFAAELLIEDSDILELLNDDSKSFFGVASELRVPAALLDFKSEIIPRFSISA